MSSGACVCVGIHVQEEAERLRATLAALRAQTAPGVDILLLADGPDPPTRAALATMGELRQSATAARRGRAACFNRLAAERDADVVVLLESGALVGPGWLERLLEALAADPRHGLAGPSTNLCWNEQGAFPGVTGTPAAIAATAALARERFGAVTRSLEPLHSLADFCYAVRREVVEAIGGADEGYGIGPCSELDYNVRAARAGFRAVWACAAYVHRAPLTAEARRAEAQHFEASKRRYQDKFCALRLRGGRTDYEAHCRGEDCEHFAPPALIQVRLPLGSRVEAAEPPAPLVLGRESTPLVSCIMPTRDRRAFALQSIRYFQRQDYPSRELIIVDDGADDLRPHLPDDPRIRYVRLAGPLSIGAKRNRGIELARGRILAQWDDDDWYAPERLRAQVAPLLAGEADITGLTAGVFFDLPAWQFWRCTPELHQRLFAGDVHGGTLVYERRVWETLARYPDSSRAEDAAFLQQAVRRRARLRRLPGDALFVYLRHAGNSWSFTCGRHVDPRGWQEVGEPPLPPEDRAFYAALSPRAPVAAPAAVVAEPLVTCIMPTADRRAFVLQAIRCFQRQDYLNRELLILDDGADAVADLVPADPRIRYVRLPGKQAIGAKRNQACELARGEIIAHWDDDDWMASRRLRQQVTSLLAAEADICGLDRLLYYDPGANAAWEYVYPGGRPWLAGGTLCYRKAFWRENRFPELSVGEDTRFVWTSRRKKLLSLPDVTFYVALIHARNSSPKRPRHAPWHPYPVDGIRDLLGDDWSFYAAVAGGSRTAVKVDGEGPLVTCIMPTYDRRLFVPQAIRYFLRQEYPRRELIVVDDGADAVQDLVPADPRVTYIRLDRRMSLGAKRNLAVEQARGEIIAHWDDDDWYHPGYLGEVARRLAGAGARDAVAGMSSYLVYLLRQRALKVARAGGIAGATLCYYRSLWVGQPYRDVAAAEDYFFLRDSRARVLGVDAPELFIVVRHAAHTWRHERGMDVTSRLGALRDYDKPLAQLVDPRDCEFYESAGEALFTGSRSLAKI
jgi:glycosyltransferase involved in cell wall biosynthesis